MEKREALMLLHKINDKLKPKVAELKKLSRGGEVQAYGGAALALVDLQNAIAEVLVEEME